MTPNVDLSQAQSEDEVFLIWSRYLLAQIIRQRECQEEAVTGQVFVFEKTENGVCILPTLPNAYLGMPARPEPAVAALTEQAVGYLVVLPTAPIPEMAWSGPSPTMSKEAARGIPISVPIEILPFDKPYDLWMSAALYTRTLERTFCAGLLGHKFGELKEVAGTFGGSLSNLRGIGVRTA